MRKGRIYKITNTINGKSYIGKTLSSIERRFVQHCNESKRGSQKLLHKAMYNNFDKFTIEVVEDNIDENMLSDKEKYYISLYKTCVFFDDANGYNMTYGGDGGSIRKPSLSEKDIEEIVNLLKNTDIPQIEIAKQYNTNLVYDINVGKSYYNSMLTYPIRKNDIEEVQYSDFISIIDMLNCKLFSQHYISEKLNISGTVISNINNGKYKKYKYPDYIKDFPIFPNKTVTYNTVIEMDIRLKILIDFINGVQRKDIVKKYGIKESYIKSLTNSISAKTKYYINDLMFPVREHKEYNLKLLNEKLNLFYKYV